MKRATAILSILLLFTVSIRAQSDTLTADLITLRIEEIMADYNARHIFADNSDPSSDLNYSLQLVSAMGRCDLIMSLFRRGADVNNSADRVATPLHYAVGSGKSEAVELLLLLGARPDMTDHYGNTPLIVSVRGDELDMTEKLIRYGSSLTLPDRHGSTPLHHAVALGNIVMTDMLLYYEAPLELRDGEGNTPLMTAVGFGYDDIADLLLQSGADPNGSDRRSFTPLMAAAQNGDTLVMSLLLNSGASLYSANDQGSDALVSAILFSQKEAVAYLLRQGNRWGKSAEKGYDPVRLANSYGETAIVKMMVESGMKGKRQLILNQLTLSAGGMFTNFYYMAGAELSLSEAGTGLGLTVGGAFDPYDKYILVNYPDNIIYQYKVRSNVIYAGLLKEVRLNPPARNTRITIAPALNIGYRFHPQYAGSDDRPDNSLVLMPAADLKLLYRRIGVSAGVTVLNMPFNHTGPLWLTLKGSYVISRQRDNITGKRIKLYSYE